MMDEKGNMMDEQDSGDGNEEEIIQEASKALSDSMPEDFDPASAEIPVDGADGSKVAVVLIGSVAGGKLADGKQIVLPLGGETQPAGEKQSRLPDVFGGGKKTEEAIK